MKIINIKSYLLTPYKCYIPRCKAHCCINVPLPENFYEQNKIAAQRQVFSFVKMKNLSYGQLYDAEIYNTAPAKQVVGLDEKRELIFGIPSQTLKAFGVKTKEDLKLFLKQQEGIHNYCPFVSTSGRCAVYPQRPPICHEFGTMPGAENYCPKKSSRWNILKYNLIEYTPLGIFKNLKALYQLKFKNA